MRSTLRLRQLLAVVFALALVAAACGRDDSSSSDNGDDGGDGGGDNGGETAGPATTDDCLQYDATMGVTDDSIKLGSSFPKSGIYQAFSKIATGYEAWFTHLNDNEDGIGGRSIEIVTEDDEYISGNTQSNYQQLTQSDQVFALLGVVGTPNNLAIRDAQNEECVPNLFAATGYPGWGQPDRFPWTIGSIPTYTTEMAMWTEFLKTREARRHHRRALPERRLRQGLPDGARGAHRGHRHGDHRRGDLRPRVARHDLADHDAGRQRRRRLRVGDHRPRLRQRHGLAAEQRLDAARLHQRHVHLEHHHVARSSGIARPLLQRHLPEGPERPDLGRRRGHGRVPGAGRGRRPHAGEPGRRRGRVRLDAGSAPADDASRTPTPSNASR